MKKCLFNKVASYIRFAGRQSCRLSKFTRCSLANLMHRVLCIGCFLGNFMIPSNLLKTEVTTGDVL